MDTTGSFYYSVENCNFKPRPFRSMGTFTKFSSIDDKIDDLHFYTYFIKFGIGRATFEVSQEIRNDHLNSEEGLKIIDKYDGEYPFRYMDDILSYLNMPKDQFLNYVIDLDPHIYGLKKINGFYVIMRIRQDSMINKRFNKLFIKDKISIKEALFILNNNKLRTLIVVGKMIILKELCQKEI